ncbi:hypothetical protein PHMEG_00028104 [Phytophthora megakarya]|uniref:Uncharacterized protein n=1 Tax=Phytophthora megakarya TaxID=4795 RepID=A0A225V8A1_9STRA|nr:hypothetical protein PHMEG_00028104 [Phytophthora megakarya]
MFCWRQASKKPLSDFSDKGLFYLRWNVLRTVVDFSDASKRTGRSVSWTESYKQS